ncbi:MAG: cyclic nucleotide-binding domain-containing protein [Elusimicrobiota bacterium]
MSGEAGILDSRPVEAKDLVWLETGLCLIGYFSSLGREQLAEILPYMLLLRYAKGAEICAEGDPGDALYLVYDGEVVVTKSGWSEPVARLTNGDFFGEMALLFGEPRSATVTAEQETEVFCLAAEDFQRVIGKTPEMSAALRKLAEARRKELARS